MQERTRKRVKDVAAAIVVLGVIVLMVFGRTQKTEPQDYSFIGNEDGTELKYRIAPDGELTKLYGTSWERPGVSEVEKIKKGQLARVQKLH